MLSGKIVLFKFAGIEIRLDYSWFLFLLLFTWLIGGQFLTMLAPGQGFLTYALLGLLGTLLILASVLAHEVTHSLVTRSRGLEIKRITLYLFGGAAQMTEEPSRPKDEILIAASGPAISFVSGFLFLALSSLMRNSQAPILTALVQLIGEINLILAIFNLLPGFPLDGGRILRGILWWKNKDLLKSTRIAGQIGIFFGYALMVLGFLEIFFMGLLGGLWIIFIGFILVQAANISMVQTRLYLTLKKFSAGQIANKKILTIDKNITLDEFIQHDLKDGEDYYFVGEKGHIQGVLSAGEIINMAHKKESITDFAEPIKNFPRVSSKENATKIIKALVDHEKPLVVVYEKNKIIGLVSVLQLNRFLRYTKI